MNKPSYYKKKCVFVWLIIIMTLPLSGQVKDTTISQKLQWPIIIPVTMIGYGTLALTNDRLQQWNRSVRSSIMQQNKTSIDDYLIYAPFIADAGLSLGKYPSKHRYVEKLGLYLASLSVNAAMVYPTKKWTQSERPDGSDLRSFPSGHTSNAFVGAEFFWQEYKDQSTWLALSGYVTATATGLLRISNDRHWFSDIVAGAGFGILSTKVTYWLYPKCKKWLGVSSNKTVLVPTVSIQYVGMVMVHDLK